jgi:hypothetical protein
MGLIECKLKKPQQETPKVENVGETFISWAEQYWGFEKNFTFGNDVNDESYSYEFIRKLFVNKINELSKNQAIESQPKL